jgi:hypothetical protein
MLRVGVAMIRFVPTGDVPGTFPQGMRTYSLEGVRMIKRLGLPSILLGLLVAPAWAANVTGAWTVKISKAEATITGKASLKQKGEMVTGWVGPSETDPIPVDGILKGNTLTLKTHPQPGRTVAFDKCELTAKGDKMVGTIDTDKGKIEFVRNSP